jgi:cullin-associated NEDD8-dissociated protein 1
MALIDLNKELARILEVNANKPGAFYVEEASEKVLTTMVLHLLTDSNAEVKAAAVACLANMSRRARPKYLNIIVNEIVKGIGAPGEKVDEEARDISCLGMYAVLAVPAGIRAYA